ncbi:MAG TPA: glycosyltransferase family 2 protein [Myxococcota bacterium]|nr:glycosyltransferase family 2 protein [Myxococcota bacterium]
MLIPCYEHGEPLRAVLEAIAPHGLPCLVIDDGSGPETLRRLDAIERELPFVRVRRLPQNRGKGVALKEGFALCASLGFTHAITLDADGQHETDAIPRFLEAMRKDPDALVLGEPIFDDSAPRSRIWARQLSRVAIWIATLSFDVRDPLCGMRGIPIDGALQVVQRSHVGDRMEFDPEFAGRWAFAGGAFRNVPVRVIYPPGGLSHFDVSRDFPVMGATYLNLWGGMLARAPMLLRRGRAS